MGTLISKIKRLNRWILIQDNVVVNEWDSIDLHDALPYDPNNTITNQWFYMDTFSGREGFSDLLDNVPDAAEIDSLNFDQFGKIDFFAYSSGDKLYLQNVIKSSYIKRKQICWAGNVASVKQLENTIFINPIPNCIYDAAEDKLFFIDIAKAYQVFKGLKVDYRTATEQEVDTFLNSYLIDAVGLDAQSVSIKNRMTISKIATVYNNYNDDQKTVLRNYIKDMVGNRLPYNEQTGKFTVDSDNNLRALLYGIQRRMYIPPLENEAQVATSTTKVSNLF